MSTRQSQNSLRSYSLVIDYPLRNNCFMSTKIHKYNSYGGLSSLVMLICFDKGDLQSEKHEIEINYKYSTQCWQNTFISAGVCEMQGTAYLFWPMAARYTSRCERPSSTAPLIRLNQFKMASTSKKLISVDDYQAILFKFSASYEYFISHFIRTG